MAPSDEPLAERRRGFAAVANFAPRTLPSLALQARAAEPARALVDFLASSPGRVLFLAESPGRRELLIASLREHGIRPEVVDGWRGFVDSTRPRDNRGPDRARPVARRPGAGAGDRGRCCSASASASSGAASVPPRTPKSSSATSPSCSVGAPVVHEDHGVGRYLGLQSLDGRRLSGGSS